MADKTQGGKAGLQRSGAAGGMGGALAVFEGLRQRAAAMPASKRNWLAASVLFLLAATSAMVWYANRPDWHVLFSGLDAKDVQQVSQELAAAAIPFQLSPDGSEVEVAADQLDKARMQVAAKGMPQTGRLGFELFDKPNWVGSEFDEKVNYQRALEGELEHTIGSLAEVRSARVHLVLPQQSLFASEEKPAKASVVLQLRRAGLRPEQADSIRNLVAGAVENLGPEQVTLVDADGRADLRAASADAETAEKEHAMEAALVSMMEPLAGRDNVRATVKVSYEDGTEEHTDEVYDPTQVAPVTMQKSEQTMVSQGKPQGVPGTASNSPAAAPVGAVQGSQAAAASGTPPLLQKEALPVYPQAGGQGGGMKEENGHYVVTKHETHTMQGPGRVRRITAAIVVNDRLTLEGAGKLQHAVWKPRSAEEMRRLEQLAQAAVGFDPRRGDQVVVENIGFMANASAPGPQGMEAAMEEIQRLLRSEPALLHTLMVGLCGVLLVLFVLRPVAARVSGVLKEPPALASGVAVLANAGGVEEMKLPAAVPARVLSDVEQERLQRSTERQGLFEQVAEHIRREPIQTTKLLETWISSPEEAQG